MDPDDIREALRIAETLLIRWEGLVLQPYLCSAGVPTIGLGSTHYMDGRRVKMTDPPITREHAMTLARFTLRSEYLRAVRGGVPNLVDPRKVGALTSLVYNIGPRAFLASTLRRKINDEQWDDVPAQWLRWDKAGGRQIRGLALRRAAELKMAGEW